MNNILQNIILGITLAAPVGPASIAIIKSGLQGGFFSAIKTALGVITADVTYIFVAYFGLASFITIPLVKTLILAFGMVVLAYLGFQTIRGALSKKEITITERPVRRNSFFEGFAVNISNPMAVVWWLGLIGSILATSTQAATNGSALLYALTVVIGIMLWHTGLSVFSHFSKRLFSSTILKYISIASGIVLFGFALRFGYNAWLTLQL
ncbi:MAG: lysine transporter LysE [Chloroflexota bacterium]|nr:MAG: lysine transporter LysE [Chloroflexota bacterium]